MSASFLYADVARRLFHLAAAGQEEAVRRGHSMLVSLTVEIPPVEPTLLFGRRPIHERILWEQPSQKLAMVAFGAATRLTSQGAQRFSHISAGWRGLLARTLVDAAPSCPLPAPVSLGGFAFAPTRGVTPDWEEYPEALLVIPRFLFISCAGSSWLTVNMLVTAGCNSQVADVVAGSQCAFWEEEEAGIREESGGSIEVQHDETHAIQWKENVSAIVKEIENGTLEKLVLARQVTAYASQPIDASAVIHRLRAGYGHCTIFAFASTKTCFVGATPERLIRLEGATVRADCLAGSTRRGATPDEDCGLGAALLANHKERCEHELVRGALSQRLAPFCTQVISPDTPRLRRLPNVQHLHSPVEGVLKDENDIFTLLSALHPSPATGGLPQETAHSLFRTYENFERGWYAGPVGWVDGRGDGEFVVAIRSALLRGHEARLFAGCGIVAGSDPEQEYQESCLKLRPMLWALNSTKS
jgi:isochorismate synthase